MEIEYMEMSYEYTVIEESDLMGIIREVNTMLCLGWHPQGGVSAIHQHSDDGDVHGRILFLQAMIKPYLDVDTMPENQ